MNALVGLGDIVGVAVTVTAELHTEGVKSILLVLTVSCADPMLYVSSFGFVGYVMPPMCTVTSNTPVTEV